MDMPPQIRQDMEEEMSPDNEDELLSSVDKIRGMSLEGKSGMGPAEDFLNSLGRFTVKHSYEATVDFLHYIGDPDREMKIIHVAGTNGKGSVCSYLTSILRASGYHVGTFTSPHIVDIRERFAIDGNMVSESGFLDAFKEILCRVMAYRASDIKRADYFPTYFEYLFFMAMVIYRDEPVDYLILEVGLGGRLDATNSVETTLLSVITEIGLDHMQYLGESYAQIAGEKAGIIRRATPLVFFDKRPESTDAILHRAEELHAPFRRVSASMIKRICPGSLENRDSKAKGTLGRIDFCYESEYYKYVSLTLNTYASYQMENAALAVTAAEELGRMGADISEEDIVKGLANSFWTCRMEELYPGFFVDGAHNEDGMTAFLSSAGEIDCIGRKHLIFGVVADKQYMNMVSMILGSGVFDTISAAVLGTSRTVSEEELRKAFEIGKDTGCSVSFFDDVKSAVDYVRHMAGKEDQIYAAGSLYLAGQIREMIVDDQF